MRSKLDDLRSGRFAGARRLKISEGLTQIPRLIFELADTLEILDLSANSISSLPDDFARLSKLQVLFLSDNDFTVFPEVLARCPNLTMISFKANEITRIPERALPKQTRWLILTDNQLTCLPDSIGGLADLQKLMLAGNELLSLPPSIARCRALQLLRISANQLTEFPNALLDLPKLAWLAFSGNPFCAPFSSNTSLPNISFDNISHAKTLGSGASGIITQANWLGARQPIKSLQAPFAVKTFKGAVTSDGYPQDELAASLAAGAHEGLIPVLAKITSGAQTGLAMELIDPSYINLGQPPDFETCTRDVFSKDFTLKAKQALKMTQSLSRTMVHLRSQNICHGDLYAHNILVNRDGDILLGDFGAASHYAALSPLQAKALEAIEVRAFGYFLEDVLGLIKCESGTVDFISSLKFLSQKCLDASVDRRPNFVQIQQRLSALQVF